MTNRRLYQVDAFTRERFAGNPAGVVANADGLTDGDMQSIAREFNNSETAFVLSAGETSHDFHARFFTPTMEVPVCGHGTIALNYVRAVEDGAACRAKQKTAAGILDIETERARDGDFRVWMHQRPAEFSQPIGEELRAQLVAALGIEPRDLTDQPVQIVSTGHSKVLIPLLDQKVLARLKPNLGELRSLSGELGCNGYYPFVIQQHHSARAVARMFAPAIGIPEDPVTGNAAGPLAAYLLHHSSAGQQSLSLEVSQGAELHRPGIVHAVAESSASGEINVKIGGDAVLVFRADIYL